MKTTITSGQLTRFLALLDEKGVTPETFQTCLSNGVLADILDTLAKFPERDEWRKLFRLGPLVPEVITLSMDYGMTLEDMIKAGNYDWKNDDLNTKNFPVKGEGIQWFEFDLVDPKQDISSEDALKLLEKDSDPANPWMPAQTEHLLALGAAFPDLQRKNPLVALGSVAEVSGDRRVPYLDGYGSGRDLRLRWFERGWGSSCRFLRFRKVSAPVASSPSA
jgi:hypothetical protein